MYIWLFEVLCGNEVAESGSGSVAIGKNQEGDGTCRRTGVYYDGSEVSFRSSVFAKNFMRAESRGDSVAARMD